ncbi:MAG: succinate dehydrogenase cytochrome b subunit [Candidatus Hydrogenedentota bacterium]
MASNFSALVGSSIFRKQVSAVTGLAMIGFVIAHLAGNLLIFAGPEAFNAYAHKLEALGPLLWVMRLGLIACVVLHVAITLTLARENTKAREQRYDVEADNGDRKLATRAMKYTGVMIVAFLALHLYDFTFGDKTGPSTVIKGIGDDSSQGLFGLVWNSFSITNGWWRDLFYIAAVSAVGLHLTHAIESAFQTFGVNHDRYTPIIKKVSLAVGILVAMTFASIPIYVALFSKPFGV